MKISACSTSIHRITLIPAFLCVCSLVAQADENTSPSPVSPDATVVEQTLVAEQPATQQPATQQPATEQPANEQPVSAPVTIDTFVAEPAIVADTSETPLVERLFLAAAPATPEATTETAPAASGNEEADPYRLRRGLRERDFSIGFGQKFPISRFDRRSDVTLFQVLPRWGRFRDDRQEFLWEVPITIATKPDTSYAAGLTLMYRYHFSSNRRFAPFAEIGAGFVITNLHSKIKELNGAFQFSPQGGVGVRTAIGESSDLIFSARWYHLSNAGTRKPNVGLNNYLVTVGYSRLF